MARVTVATFGAYHSLALTAVLAVSVLEAIWGYKVLVHSLTASNRLIKQATSTQHSP
jgi:hypothetical protein